MPKESSELNLILKQVQIEKLNGQLVKKEIVQKQFLQFYELLFTEFENLILSAVKEIISMNEPTYEAVAGLLLNKLHALKDDFESADDKIKT